MDNFRIWIYLYFAVFGFSGMVFCVISLIRCLLSDVRSAKKKKEGESNEV